LLMRLPTLCWLAILLWLSYGITLWPLPPQEVAETVALYKRLMAEPSPLEKPEWKSRPDLEQKEGQRKYLEFLDVAQEIIDRAPELKARLWWEWAGRAALLVVAGLGWLYLAKIPRISRAVIAVTIGILLIGQIVVYWVIYSNLVQSWVAGHSGMKYRRGLTCSQCFVFCSFCPPSYCSLQPLHSGWPRPERSTQNERSNKRLQRTRRNAASFLAGVVRARH